MERGIGCGYQQGLKSCQCNGESFYHNSSESNITIIAFHTYLLVLIFVISFKLFRSHQE